MAVNLPTDREHFKQFLNPNSRVTIEEAIFRSEQAFRPASLQESLKFWEEEILREHPQKDTLLKWIQGVKIGDFLKSFTQTEFQGIKLNSYYPPQHFFPNDVPPEFEKFMDETVEEWVSLGILQKWEQVRTPEEPPIPEVVSPLPNSA